ncbi:hypothetical protein ACTQ54_11210 [Fundicoccus sp. Sow4_H7]|uniref:hypothetical protein n=1 Tax=Fundicoccus sp. Sow4_H7 TaxID=3438784 RepID=UPI003F8ECFC1
MDDMNLNDAYFRTINESMGFTDIKDQVKIWSIPSTVLWAVATISLLILNGCVVKLIII